MRLHLAVSAAVLACLAAAGANAAGNPARGKDIAEKKCALCHAVGPTGDSAAPKAPPFRTLSERYPIDSLQEALAEGITVGHEGVAMPEFRMEPREIDDFLSYLNSINK
jgi:mono/diheme cytochrome c family protein